MHLARACTICDTYFQYRNIGRFGFVKYSIIKALIKYITNITDDRKLRRVFDKLVVLGIFETLRPQKHQVLYLYNPKNLNYTYRLNGLVEFIT